MTYSVSTRGEVPPIHIALTEALLRTLATAFAGTKLAEACVYRVGGWLRARMPQGTVRTASVRGKARIAVPIHEDPSLGRLYFTGRYEDNVQAMSRAILRRGDVALDAGANIGVHTVYLASLVGREGKVHAFEPVPRSFAWMRQAVALNGWDDRVVLNAVALSDCSGSASFYVSQGVAMTSSLRRYPWLVDSGTITVPTTTLDEYAFGALGRIRLVKIDVEGAEMQVIRGGLRLFTECPPEFAIVEQTSANEADGVLQQMRALGYEQVELHKGRFRVIEREAPAVSLAWPLQSDFVLRNVCFRHLSVRVP